MFAFAPRNAFDNDAVFGTGYTAHLIQEEDGNVPKRHELKAAGGAGSVVDWTGADAFGAEDFAVFARMKDCNDMLIRSIFLLKGNIAEAEGLVMGDKIEYSFNKHLGEGAK